MKLFIWFPHVILTISIYHQLRARRIIITMWVMFCWEPEGHYCCTKSMAIAPFLFPSLMPFWGLSRGDCIHVWDNGLTRANLWEYLNKSTQWLPLVHVALVGLKIDLCGSHVSNRESDPIVHCNNVALCKFVCVCVHLHVVVLVWDCVYVCRLMFMKMFFSSGLLISKVYNDRCFLLPMSLGVYIGHSPSCVDNKNLKWNCILWWNKILASYLQFSVFVFNVFLPKHYTWLLIPSCNCNVYISTLPSFLFQVKNRNLTKQVAQLSKSSKDKDKDKEKEKEKVIIW